MAGSVTMKDNFIDSFCDVRRLSGWQAAKRWAERSESARDIVTGQETPAPPVAAVAPPRVIVLPPSSRPTMLVSRGTQAKPLSVQDTKYILENGTDAFRKMKITDAVSAAMRARWKELIADPLDRIWDQLAKTAIDTMMEGE